MHYSTKSLKALISFVMLAFFALFQAELTFASIASKSSHTDLNLIPVNKKPTNGVPVPPHSLETLYNFTKVDTLLYSTGPSKHLAVMQEGNQFVFVDAYGEEPNERKEVVVGGFILRRMQLSGGKLTLIKESAPIKVKFGTWQGNAVNTFVKTDYGYVIAGSDIITVVDNDFNEIETASLPKYIVLGVQPIKGTKELVFMTISKSTWNICLDVYDVGNKKYITSLSRTIGNFGKYLRCTKETTGVRQTPDGNLFVTLATDGLEEKQYFYKINYAQLKASENFDDALIWSRYFPVFLAHLDIDQKGEMKALVRFTGETLDHEKLQVVKGNTLAETGQAFAESFKSLQTSGWDQCSLGGVSAGFLPDGRLITAGMGLELFGNLHSIAFTLYDTQMQVVRAYRLPTPFDNGEQKTNYSGFHSAAASLVSTTDKRYSSFGVDYESVDGITSDRELFMRYFAGSNASYSFLPGPTKDEVYILTPLAFIKVNLLSYTPSKTKSEAVDRIALRKENEAAYGGQTTEVAATPTTTNAPKPTTPKPQETKNTKITIINDLPEDLNTNNHIKLAFNSGPLATTYLLRNKSLVIDCEDVKAVHAGLAKSSGWGKLLFKCESYCGQTVKLSEVW